MTVSEYLTFCAGSMECPQRARKARVPACLGTGTRVADMAKRTAASCQKSTAARRPAAQSALHNPDVPRVLDEPTGASIPKQIIETRLA
jgi:hypothetical protein